MKKAVTIGIDEKGAATVLAAPSVPFDDQCKKFNDYKAGKLPKELARVELYFCHKQTTGIDRNLGKQTQDGWLIDLDGKTYPPEVYAARVAWRANDAAERTKAETEGKKHKPSSAIPTKLSDLPKPTKAEKE